jgi:hypothetical protein
LIKFLLTTLWLLATAIAVQAQSSANATASVTIISANKIGINEQTNITFDYSTIINSVSNNDENTDRIPDHSLENSFCIASINISSEDLFANSITMPSVIPLIHSQKGEKINIATSINNSTSQTGLINAFENISLEGCIDFKPQPTIGLYNSTPFEIIINYN